MVFYFTATGNSLYVAKQLDENPVSIPQILKHDNLNISDANVGIVFPIYAGRAPEIVLDFLKKATIKTEYLYFIGTYGNSDSAICKTLPEECARIGLKIDYINTIAMVDNYLPVFDMEQEIQVNKGIEKKMDEIR